LNENDRRRIRANSILESEFEFDEDEGNEEEMSDIRKQILDGLANKRHKLNSETEGSTRSPSVGTPTIKDMRRKSMLEIDDTDDFFEYFRDRPHEEHYAHIIESDSDNEMENAIAVGEYLANARRGSIDALSASNLRIIPLPKVHFETGSLAKKKNSRRGSLHAEVDIARYIDDDIFGYFTSDTTIFNNDYRSSKSSLEENTEKTDKKPKLVVNNSQKTKKTTRSRSLEGMEQQELKQLLSVEELKEINKDLTIKVNSVTESGEMAGDSNEKVLNTIQELSQSDVKESMKESVNFSEADIDEQSESVGSDKSRFFRVASPDKDPIYSTKEKKEPDKKLLPQISLNENSSELNNINADELAGREAIPPGITINIEDEDCSKDGILDGNESKILANSKQKTSSLVVPKSKCLLQNIPDDDYDSDKDHLQIKQQIPSTPPPHLIRTAKRLFTISQVFSVSLTSLNDEKEFSSFGERSSSTSNIMEALITLNKDPYDAKLNKFNEAKSDNQLNVLPISNTDSPKPLRISQIKTGLTKPAKLRTQNSLEKLFQTPLPIIPSNDEEFSGKDTKLLPQLCHGRNALFPCVSTGNILQKCSSVGLLSQHKPHITLQTWYQRQGSSEFLHDIKKTDLFRTISNRLDVGASTLTRYESLPNLQRCSGKCWC